MLSEAVIQLAASTASPHGICKPCSSRICIWELIWRQSRLPSQPPQRLGIRREVPGRRLAADDGGQGAPLQILSRLDHGSQTPSGRAALAATGSWRFRTTLDDLCDPLGCLRSLLNIQRIGKKHMKKFLMNLLNLILKKE